MFSESSSSTSVSCPLCSPARTSETNTPSKTYEWLAIASESFWPPSMSSSRLAITCLKPGFSIESRRSVSASMMFTPAFSSCERWKQKVISSSRETRRVRARDALPRRLEGEEVEPEALQAQLEVDRVDGVQVAGGERPSASTAR